MSEKTTTAAFSYSDLTLGVSGPNVLKCLLTDDWGWTFGQEDRQVHVSSLEISMDLPPSYDGPPVFVRLPCALRNMNRRFVYDNTAPEKTVNAPNFPTAAADAVVVPGATVSTPFEPIDS